MIIIKSTAYYLFIFLLFFFNDLEAQSTFQKTYGGPSGENCWTMIPTLKNNFILIGNTNSYGPNNTNIYVIELNNDGDTLWTKAYGGMLSESGYDIKATSDGGYLISASTYSFGAGNADAMIVKIDSIGNVKWSKVFGGPNNDDVVSIQPTFDGGYMLLGSSASFGAGPTDFDIYLIKTDSIGDTLWTKTIGGSAQDNGLSMQQTLDSGFVITGYTASYGVGKDDVYLLKVDNNGNIIWFKTYGGNDSEVGSYLYQTKDGGFIIVGKTHSFGSLDGDIYLIKTKSNGDLVWSKKYGALGTEWAKYIIENPDGSLILAGETYSFGVSQNAHLVKTDSNGILIWSRIYGDSNHDRGTVVAKNNDGGYILAGHSNSFSSSSDIYVVKIDSNGFSGCNESNASISTSTITSLLTNVIPNIYSTNTNVYTPNIINASGASLNKLCSTVAQEEFKKAESSLIIYPNPTSNFIEIKSDDKISSIIITDAIGKIVKTVKLTNTKIDVSDLQQGIYFIKLKNGESKLIKKFIKQ